MKREIWERLAKIEVAEHLALFVFGRSKELRHIQPTLEWLNIWHYLFLAGQIVKAYMANMRVAEYLALCIFGRSHELWGGEGTLASKVITLCPGTSEHLGCV
jgi:hypothetical protein